MKLLAALLIGVGAHIALASPAMAEPCTGVYNQGSCRPAPWNGQQMDTWNIPGTYGGWTNNPVACNPLTTKCVMWGQP